MPNDYQFERLGSHISREYARIKSDDFRLDKALYGKYDNAPPTVIARDKLDTEANSSISHYAKNLVQKFISICTAGFSYLFRLLCIAFTVSLIVIGSYYVHNCSCQPFIPIYLIVSGCLLCLLIFYAVYRSCTITDIENSKDLNETSRNLFRYITDFLYLFVFGWFITGSVKVYKIHAKVNFYNATSDCYCQPLVYKFTFWSITSFYMVLASVLMMGLLTMIVKYMCVCFRK